MYIPLFKGTKIMQVSVLELKTTVHNQKKNDCIKAFYFCSICYQVILWNCISQNKKIWPEQFALLHPWADCLDIVNPIGWQYMNSQTHGRRFNSAQGTAIYN